MKRGFMAMMVVGGISAGLADAMAQEAGTTPSPSVATSAKLASPVEPIGRGLTFEANVGLALLRTAPNHGANADDPALAGLNLGVGRWISSHAAMTLRIAGVTFIGDGLELPSGFAGGTVQLWTCKRFWFGGGLGAGFATADFSEGADPDAKFGLAVDGRVGITPYLDGRHSFNVSFEVTSVFLERGSVTSMGLLLGYQAL